VDDVDLTPQPTPVFVDDSGRRRRVFRVFGWLTGAIAVGFLVLVGISLVASPGLLPLSLPGVGSLLPNASAPQIVTKAEPGHKKVPAATLLPTPAARAGGSTGTSPTPSATLTRGNRLTAMPTPSATVTRGNRPTVTPTPSASATATSHGNPSPHGSPRPTHTSHGNR
jgi:hypothetical protein